MGKTRRNAPDSECDYAPVEHRIPRSLLRRAWQIPRHIGSVVVTVPEEQPYELPSPEEADGMARDEALDIIQTAAEQLVASMQLKNSKPDQHQGYLLDFRR